MRRVVKFILMSVLVLVGTGAFAATSGNSCVNPLGGGMPFPLGQKAPLPWESIDGYWSEFDGLEYFYRIEVLEVYKDNSRTVSVSLMNESGFEVVATGLGFVRANAMDLWARVKGTNIDLKIRLQAFYPKDSLDMSRRALVASLKDMQTQNACMVRHMLRKVDTLEGRTVEMPENYKQNKK